MEALKRQLLGVGLQEIHAATMQGVEIRDEMFTMIGYKRLTNLESLINDVVDRDIHGDIIETGVWRGGACIFASKLLEKLKSDKTIFIADSFEGLPKPTYKEDEGDYHYAVDFLSVSQESVQSNFHLFNCPANYQFVKGWFKDTLHLLDNLFSIIRLDGDMYESTIQALDALYPKLSIGGYCIIDDFGAVVGCNKAVADYRQSHNITDKIINIDSTGVYWQKTK